MTTVLRSLIAVYGLVSGVAIAADPPNTRPAPASVLRDNALQLPDGNAAVPPPPGSGWRWLQTDLAEHPVFLCVNDAVPEVLTVSGHSYGATKVSARFLTGFLRGVNNAAAKQQKHFRSLSPPPPPTPGSPAVGFSYSLQSPDGQLQHAFGYVIPTGRLTVIQALTAHASLPAWLPALAAGVQALRPLSLQEAFPAIRVASWVWPHLLLGTVAWGGVRLLHRPQSTRPLNPWKAVIVALLVTTALDVLLLARSSGFENMQDHQPAEALGIVTAAPIVLLLISGYLHHRHERHTATFSSKA